MRTLAATLILSLTIITLCVCADGRMPIYDEQADGRELIAVALEKANMEGKRVLITWGANWCGWCYHLKEQRDTHAGIRALMVERYVAINVDLGNRDRHMALALEYGLDFKNLRIPHMTVLDESGKPAGQKQPTELAVEEGGKTVYSQERIFAFVNKDWGSDKGVGDGSKTDEELTEKLDPLPFGHEDI